MHSKLVAQTRYDIAREKRLHLTAVAPDRDLEDFLQSFQLLSDSGRHGPSEMENTAMANRPLQSIQMLQRPQLKLQCVWIHGVGTSKSSKRGSSSASATTKPDEDILVIKEI